MSGTQHPATWSEAVAWLDRCELQVQAQQSGWIDCERLIVEAGALLDAYRRKPPEPVKVLQFWAICDTRDWPCLGFPWTSPEAAAANGNDVSKLRHFREVPPAPQLSDTDLARLWNDATSGATFASDRARAFLRLARERGLL